MEAVILIGIQGAGKSTFYERRFASTHLRISMDIAGTRVREQRIVEDCLRRNLDFVVDNTNATVASRGPVIAAARLAGFRIVGYFFTTNFKLCLERNAARSGKARVPVPGLYRIRKFLQPPSMGEGFEELFVVNMDEEEIRCERWNDSSGGR